MESFWIIDQLVQQGVRHFCIAPGSRSTPLVLAAADHPKATTHVHFDERGLGFFALGISQGARVPAALIVTSGTAVGNLLPSIMEAHHSCIPLLLLTADRPAELRDCSSNQATDQIKIFSPFIRWQTDLPPTLNERYYRSTMAQAVFHACQNPAGPVQINCQFREPWQLSKYQALEGKPIALSYPRLTPAPIHKSASRGVICMGRLENPTPVLNLAKRLRWPIFADLLSNARSTPTPEQIRHFDWILKRGADLKPDLILHFGERLTSKKSLEWLKEIQPCELIHIGPNPHLIDPARLVTHRIQAHPEEFSFHAQTDPSWLPAWQTLDAEIDSLIEEHFQENTHFTEAHAMRALQNIPFPLFVGNGMPIRDADHFLFPQNNIRFFCNRGLSGIDGNIATAAGLSIGLNSPLIAFIGDQAALHDLNSLSLLKKSQVQLIISNNFGSGMFSHLPISSSPHFNEFFAIPHTLTFQKAAELFDIPYSTSLPLHSAPSLLEITTCRTQNYQFQKELTQKCSLAPI